MNSAATTTANDLQKNSQEKLQIDASLANTTDLTAPLTFTTPVNSNDISDEWKDFYAVVEKTPPKATRDVEYQVAVDKANKLLRLSDIEGFKDKSFENLTKDQQAIVMFMITKKMDEVTFEGGRPATVLISALEPETEKYNNMLSFVNKGGDSKCRAPSVVVNRFNATLREFTEGCQGARTIFQNKNVDMSPCLFMQRECSYICTFNTCSALIYYRSYGLRTKPGKDQSISAIRTNISRYIRDEIDPEAIANVTLTTKKGAYLTEILAGLSKSFGTVQEDPEEIFLWETEASNYNRLMPYIEFFGPFALSIECFPGLEDRQKKEFTGKLSDHYRNQEVNYSERPENPEDRFYHAVLCIGIKPRKGETPPMLLVQDSYPERPAFSIGLDLLSDMEFDNLEFCTLHRKWGPNPGMCYEVTKKSKVHFAGSPMMIDKNGEVHILKPKKPVPEKRDMCRYLHDDCGKDFYVYEM